MTVTIKPNPLPKFRPLYQPPAGTWLIINIGGRGGGKSHEVSKWATLEALTKDKRIALLRDEQSTIAQSIMHEIKMRYAEINEKAGGYFNAKWEMQDNGLKNREKGVLHVFSKGFRTSKTNQKAGLKSIADVDIAILEEFEDISDEEKFNTFADSIRKEGALIVINSNVPSKNHWFVKRYFNLRETQYEQYYELLPKEIPGVVYIFSSYLDNPHLSQNTISRYRAYGDPESNLYNLEHYITDILGLVSEGAKGRIYKAWEIVSEAEYAGLPYPKYYGLDFGYSADPLALIELKSHNNKTWCKEMIYEAGLTNPQLVKRMDALSISKKAEIYADSAEPKSIRELRDAGFNVIPALKGPDSLLSGIKHLQGREMHVTENSSNLKHENQEYKWQLDADANPTDTPVDKHNHGKDAVRYGEVTRQTRGGFYGFKRAN